MIDEVIVNGIDVTSKRVTWVVEDEWDKSISEVELVLFKSVEDLGITSVGQTITIRRGFDAVTEDFVFRGEITQRKPLADSIILIAKNRLNESIKSRQVKSWDKDIDTEAGVGSEIFKAVCTNSGLTTTSASVPTTGTAIPDKIIKFIQNDEDNYQKLNELAERYNRIIRYQASDDTVYFQPKGFTTYPITLNVGVEIPGQIKWKENMEQLINKVTINGATVLDSITETIAGPLTTFPLTKTPEGTEVRQTNSAGALFTRGQKNIGTIGTDFDYYVEPDQKTFTFSGSKSNIWIQYGAQVPMPIVLTNSTSIATY
ncbi:MAG: hypothetical protein IIC67_04435, partial [Thaumarchaeota archaeon]|nr:hypothetical protein [Nitrososphaerota archaeon]